jgi:hypothetical protein
MDEAGRAQRSEGDFITQTNGPKDTHTVCFTEHTHKAYISMKMDPNGRIPPRQTMTAGSMNLGEHSDTSHII